MRLEVIAALALGGREIQVTVEDGPECRPDPVQDPLRGVALGGNVLVQEIVQIFIEHLLHEGAQVFLGEDSPTLRVDELALFVHHVIVFEQVFADLEVASLDLLLGPLDAAGNEAVLDGFVLAHAQTVHDRGDALRAEDAQQIVLQRKVEAGGPRVTLPAGTAPQLVVNATALMALGAQDEEAAGSDDLAVLLTAGFLEFMPHLLEQGFVAGGALARQEFRVAAQYDVRTPSGHVGGDGNGAFAPGLGHDLRLPLVVFGIEDRVAHPPLLQEGRDLLRVLDGAGAHEYRLPRGMAFHDLIDDGLEFFMLGLVDDVWVVLSDHGLVSGHHEDVEIVDLLEFEGLGLGRAGHAGELLIHAEIVLEGDGGQGLVLVFDLDVLLGLQGLMQTLGVTPSRHEPPGELVHDEHLTILDHIVHVTRKEGMRPQRLVEVVDGLELGGLVEVALSQDFLHHVGALFREHHGVGLLVLADELVRLSVPQQLHDGGIGLVVLGGGFLGLTGDDQRGAGLVDQDRVHLVHDGVEKLALHIVIKGELHVVPQVVEPELVVGTIGDVGAVGLLALTIIQAVHDDAHVQSQETVDRPHPFGIASGQIVIDRHHVHTSTGQGVEVDGHGGDQGLALSRLHLRDLALVQDDPADELHVEGPHGQHSTRDLAHGGEGLGQKMVKLFAPGQPFPEMRRKGPEVLVRQGAVGVLKGVDAFHQGGKLLDFPFVLASDDLHQPFKHRRT